MANRYSQIKRGLEYQTALDNYTNYLKNIANRPTKRLQGGTRGARRDTVAATVRPFGRELDTGEFALTRVGTDSKTGLGDSLNGRIFYTGANFTGGIKIQGFKPARVTGFRGTGAATYVRSKVTQLYYLKYAGDTYSAPFGAVSDTEEEFTGGTAVKTAVLALFGGADIKRVSISPEKIPV